MKKNIKSININIFKSPLYLYWAFLFSLFAINSSYSQLDSLKYKFDSKPTIGLKMETKNFVIHNYWSRIQEIKPYLEFEKNIRIGVGYAWLKKGHEFSSQNDTLTLKINAISLFGAYVFEYNKNWTIELPLDFGFGFVSSNDTENNRGYYSFYEPSLIMEYHGFKYVNLGLGTGFRISGHKEEVYPNALTTQTFIFRFSLKFSEIYKQFMELNNS